MVLQSVDACAMSQSQMLGSEICACTLHWQNLANQKNILWATAGQDVSGVQVSSVWLRSGTGNNIAALTPLNLPFCTDIICFCMALQLEKANRSLAELSQQHAQAEAERAGLIEKAVQATALAGNLQKQVHICTQHWTLGPLHACSL